MSNEENTKILLIVDDKVVRESIALYLSAQGYRISNAASPEEAVECFHSFNPDLVLCDINIAGFAKFEVIESVFEIAPNQAIVVLADKDSTDDIVTAMGLGVSDYFINPLDDLAILELSLRNNLKRARILAENRSYRKKMEEVNHELESSLEIFKADQQAGRHVQVSMLPKPPQTIGNFKFNHRVIPSLYLSGDSVDYKPLSKNKILFYIADVSGHGSSSAFLTILLRFRIEQMRREYIRGRFSDDFTPASILASLNKDLLDASLDKHITMFIGLLDQEEDTLCYSVAGHHPLPVIYSQGEAKFIKIAKSSFPIGLLEEAEYFEESISLTNDFSLTLFSDGILEILQMDSMLKKEKHLLEVIAESKGDFENIKSKLGLNSIGNVPDDIAVMIVGKS